MADLDYYEILGIEHSATAEEIKSAYRQLSKKYHPDANDAKNANTFFRLIHEAYEILSNQEKRKAYDNRHLRKNTYTEDTADSQNDYDSSDFEEAYNNENSYSYKTESDATVSRNNLTDGIAKKALKFIGKFIVKVFLLPIVILLLFFNFIFSWFGGIGAFILKISSGFLMVVATLLLVFSLIEGNFKEELLMTWPVFVIAFIISALALVVSFIPDIIQDMTSKMLALFLS